MINKRIAKYFINKLRYKHFSKFNRTRIRYYKKIVKAAGDNIIIKAGVIIKNPDKLILGNNISIQENCFFSCYGGLTVGNNVSFATGTKIFTSNHDYKHGIIRDNKLIVSPTVIGSNVWIGADVKILSGVNIADNVVIAAGAVVNKDCKSYGVYAGVPAKRITDFNNSGEKNEK